MVKPVRNLPPEVVAALQRQQMATALKLLLQSRLAGPEREAGREPVVAQPRLGRPAAPGRTAAAERPAAAADSGLSPGEVSRSASSAWGWVSALVVVALLAYLAWRLLH